MIEELLMFGMSLLIICLLAPIVSLLSGKRIFRTIILSVSLVGLLCLITASVSILISGETFARTFYSIAPGWSMAAFIDRLSAFFILLISTVSFGVIIYSFGYIEHDRSDAKRNFFVMLMFLFISSMIMIVTSANMFTFLFFWELMALSSVFLVMYDDDKPQTRKAAMFYFIMTQLCTLFLIIGFMILSSAGQSFLGGSSITSFPLLGLSFILLFLAFGTKAGIIPLHKWLPYAHPASPSNISALMSGIMIKVAIYGLVRFILSVADPQLWWGIMILVIGTLSAILGVLYALKEHDIKRLLAYHSIENIGIILIGIGLYIIFAINSLPSVATLCLVAALFHTLNHALFKSLLFMTAGSVVNATKTKNIEEMGGLINRMPFTAALFLVGAIAISALPPFNGFVSELMIFQAFFQAGLIHNQLLQILLVSCVSILALTSALAAACFVKAFGIIFLGVPRSKHATQAVETHKSMIIGPAIIAALCLLLGVFSFQIFNNFFQFAFPIPNMLVIGLLLLIVYLLAWIIISQKERLRKSATWSCGYPLTDGTTEYTASGFSEPIIKIFSPIYTPKYHVEKEFHDKHNVLLKGGHVEINLMKFFEEKLYSPILDSVNWISRMVSKMQSGVLDMYIAYIFVTCIILIIIMGFVL